MYEYTLIFLGFFSLVETKFSRDLIFENALIFIDFIAMANPQTIICLTLSNVIL